MVFVPSEIGSDSADPSVENIQEFDGTSRTRFSEGSAEYRNKSHSVKSPAGHDDFADSPSPRCLGIHHAARLDPANLKPGVELLEKRILRID